MDRRHRRIKVSVVVPAHNEEGNIDLLLEEFAKTFRECEYPVEVVMVDDGSTDDTGRKISAGARRYRFVRKIHNRVRMGLTTALTKGFAAARGEILVFYPADLQFLPRDIPRMVTAIDNGADMICGKKVGKYGKWFVSRIYNVLTRLLFRNLKVTDMNSVKAFRREVYRDLPTLREGWHRYIPVFAASQGYMVREVPVTLSKRHSGQSKFSGRSRILKGLTDLIAVKFQLSVLGDPMHLFGKLSLYLFVIGFLVAAVAFYLRFAMHSGYRPLLYVVILFELSSLITFVMGIILETLVYLRDSLTESRQESKRLAETVDRLSAAVDHLSRPSSQGGNGSKEGGRPSQRQRRRRSSSRHAEPQQQQRQQTEEIKVRPLPDQPTEKQDGS
jgi:glycosyltransferase involved in cell wall biosynthesis